MTSGEIIYNHLYFHLSCKPGKTDANSSIRLMSQDRQNLYITDCATVLLNEKQTCVASHQSPVF